MSIAFDCYDSNVRYLGVYHANDYAELIQNHPKIFYVAGAKAHSTGKHWSELKEEDLDQIRERISTPFMNFEVHLPVAEEHKLQTLFESNEFLEEEPTSIPEEIVINHQPIELPSNVRALLETELKEKTKKKKDLLAEVRKLRSEIKELQEQLNYS